MANLLRISGIPVPVLVGSAAHHPTQIGDNERAEDGSRIISRRAIKETYKLTVTHQDPVTAFAFRDLLIGKGECWNFDSSVYGSKGSGPSTSTNAVQNATAKYGAGGCQLTLSTGTISYAVLPAGGTTWTVMVWRKIGAGAFQHFVVTSGGHKWVDGVRNDAASTTWLTVTTATGTVKLDADAVSTTNLDDLVILPYVVPDGWPPNVQALGRAFSQLAYLDVDGDLIEGNVGSKSVEGSVSGMMLIPATIGGVFYQHVQTVEVELNEI